jgi:formylglycine-generating enzyme required for sulfatase activity
MNPGLSTHRHLTAIALLLALAMLPSFAAPAPAEASLEPSRPQNTDLLLLSNGQTVTCTIRNETFRLRTSYALLDLKKQFLTTLDFTRAPHGLVFVETVNSNQFTGFLEDQSFRVQSTNDEPQEIRRERIARVTFNAPEQRPAQIKQGQWIRLKSGDLFSGQPGELAAQTDDRLTFTLDLGPAISLYRESIDSIDGRGFSGASAAAAVTDAQNCSTNREGLVWIPPGEFLMGSTAEEAGRDPDEGPQTKVRITQGFWMAKYEVTQTEYQRVIGLNPSHATGEPTRPVEYVNWFDAIAYCAKVNELAAAAGTLPKAYAYRLPTEAEWEYACRAGSTTRFCYGDDRSDVNLGDYAWFARNSESATHPVGAKKPNSWGLCDMHGNVWEWCLDRWEGALPGGVITNTPVSAKGGLRTARGGSWLYEGKSCRSANRDDYSPFNRCSDVGFRVVLAPAEP